MRYTALIFMILISLQQCVQNVKAEKPSQVDQVRACVQDSEDIDYTLEDIDKLIDYCIEESHR